MTDDKAIKKVPIEYNIFTSQYSSVVVPKLYC